MLGIVFGTAFFTIGEACWDACAWSRTRRTAPDRFSAEAAEVVVAEENAESEFVDSMRSTVRRIP